ncbi:MAG: EFR1 family ferrodoxin [Spirochaetaceae bacterium]|jgi:flavodoxin/ferredoxin|nr:EFR1 family ferrodoxin [Spirochaetaceae bacterium]
MKSIVIYYFSGTGNTLKVSQLLKEALEIRGSQVKLISIESLMKNSEKIEIVNYDLIGIAYPIYGFGTPSLIEHFIKNFPEGKGKDLFLYKTGADFISINHNASVNQIIDLEKKGYNVFYDRIIAMSPNWIFSYDNRITKQLYLTAVRKVKHMSQEILGLQRRRNHTGPILKGLSKGIAYCEDKYGAGYFGKSLKTNLDCNMCGICQNNCPNGNIKITENKIIFSDQCLWCMRCVYNCPQKAIFSKGLNFCIIKDGYNLDKILNDESISSEFIRENTKGYFKHFIKYISDDSI